MPVLVLLPPLLPHGFLQPPLECLQTPAGPEASQGEGSLYLTSPLSWPPHTPKQGLADSGMGVGVGAGWGWGGELSQEQRRRE